MYDDSLCCQKNLLYDSVTQVSCENEIYTDHAEQYIVKRAAFNNSAETLDFDEDGRIHIIECSSSVKKSDPSILLIRFS